MREHAWETVPGPSQFRTLSLPIGPRNTQKTPNGGDVASLYSVKQHRTQRAAAEIRIQLSKGEVYLRNDAIGPLPCVNI